MTNNILTGLHEQGRGVLWSYGGKGVEISTIVAAVGTAISGVLGGWDEILQTLLWFMVADFVLGFLSAAKRHEVKSEAMFWGGINKVLVLVVVAIGVRLDLALGLTAPYIRTMMCWFYLGREGLSLLENSGKLGFPWPTFVTKLLAELKDKGDNGGKESTVTEQVADK